MAYNYVTLGSVYSPGNVFDDNVGTASAETAGNVVGNIVTPGYAYVGNSAKSTGGQQITVNSTHAWNVTGTAANDVIYGGSGADFLSGGGATVADTIYGGAGKDTIRVADVAGNVVVGDYVYGEDIISANAVDLAAVTFGNNGTLTANSAVVTIGTSANYSKVTISAGADKANVWFGSTTAATMDATAETSNITFTGDNNVVSDSIYGGAGKDTIYAGVNDVVWGGTGSDSIVATGMANVVVGLNTATGTDTVTGFQAGTNASNSVVYLFDSSISNATISAEAIANGNVFVSTGSGKLQLTGIGNASATGETDVLVKDTTGTTSKVAVVAKDGLFTSADANYYVGASVANAATLSFGSVTTAQVIDLGNTGLYGDTRKYSNVTKVTGTNYEDTLVGAAATADSLDGGAGNDSLWGGTGIKADNLTGGTGDDVFFFGANNGNDIVTDYNTNAPTTEADVIRLYDGSAVTGVTADASNVYISIGTSKLDLKTNTITSTAAATVNVQSGTGTTVKASVGLTGTANTLTYAADTTYYYGGNQTDTVTASGTDNFNIWLDGSKGATYSSIENITGGTATGDLQLAGDSKSNVITGGAGNSSLWGGAGAVADTLISGAGVDTFYYGKGEGNDVIAVGSQATDKVMLYNVATSDITSAAIASGNLTIALKDGGSLTVKGFGDGSGAVNSFTLGADNTTWSYSSTTKTWAKA